jgi:hypothetical protein
MSNGAMERVNLSAQQQPDWALFLPAISSFYIAGLGKQIKGEQYFPQARIPQGIPDLESLNFLNSTKGLFTYKWGLYSAGHANIDPNDPDSSETIIREREAGTFMLGDSGGFQIMKGQWPGDWKDPSCPKAMKKRKAVLKWMDTYMDYGMVLDVPSQTVRNQHLYDKHGIKTIGDAVTATHINNEYFINNRTGECKFLNVLQGLTHKQSDEWYAEMKDYCDPIKYPGNHFNGWAMGGQNKIDIHLFLRRIVNIIHDGLLVQGKHDWIHCLGTSILEYAVIFSDVQRAIRKYHNPDVTISFDCATPFFAVSKGLIYNTTLMEHNKKWTYTEEKTAENKKYATDNRKFKDAVLADAIHKVFFDSPITDKLLISDVCYRGVGFLGQHGKETKTSWDTLSYTLIQAHNVYKHMLSVQDANRRYDSGIIPKMLVDGSFDNVNCAALIDEIFSLNDRQKSLELIDRHSRYWMQVKSGQGYSGKKAVNSLTMFNSLFA